MNRHSLEVPIGHKTNTPPLVKHAVRLGRRMRARGIWYAEFPPFIDDGRNACKVIIGARQINVFDDGSYTRSLLRADGQPDGRAFLAQSYRMHAIYMAMGASARLNGLLACARGDLQLATQERLHHERRS